MGEMTSLRSGRYQPRPAWLRTAPKALLPSHEEGALEVPGAALRALLPLGAGHLRSLPTGLCSWLAGRPGVRSTCLEPAL